MFAVMLKKFKWLSFQSILYLLLFQKQWFEVKAITYISDYIYL